MALSLDYFCAQDGTAPLGCAVGCGWATFGAAATGGVGIPPLDKKSLLFGVMAANN